MPEEELMTIGGFVEQYTQSLQKFSHHYFHQHVMCRGGSDVLPLMRDENEWKEQFDRFWENEDVLFYFDA